MNGSELAGIVLGSPRSAGSRVGALTLPRLEAQTGPWPGRGRSWPKAALLLTAAFVLMGLAWAASLPYDGIGDEEAHYERAVATAHLELVGKKVPLPPGTDRLPPTSQIQVRYLYTNTRAFAVPKQLNPRDNVDCFILKPAQPASCLHTPGSSGTTTAQPYVGTYPPFSYLVPGILASFFTTPANALFAARIGNGLVCAAMWGLAAIGFLARSRRKGWLLTGLMCSITPSAVCLAWCVNPNGVEAAAALAFVATLLAATRSDAPASSWWLVGIAGFVLGASRPTTPIWLVTTTLTVIAFRGIRPFFRRLRAGGRPAAGAVTLVGLGGLSTILWDVALAAQAPAAHRDWLSLTREVWHSFWYLQAGVISQVDWGEVGGVGRLPRSWEILVAVFLVIALLVGSWRQRATVVLALCLYFFSMVGMLGLSMGSGFPIGGRYVLATAVVLPMLSAEICQWRLPRIGTVAAAVAALTVAESQMAVLFESSRRYAVGVRGTLKFLWSGSIWSPAGGWGLVMAFALAGCLVLAAGCFFADGLSRGRA